MFQKLIEGTNWYHFKNPINSRTREQFTVLDRENYEYNSQHCLHVKCNPHMFTIIPAALLLGAGTKCVISDKHQSQMCEAHNMPSQCHQIRKQGVRLKDQVSKKILIKHETEVECVFLKTSGKKTHQKQIHEISKRMQCPGSQRFLD